MILLLSHSGSTGSCFMLLFPLVVCLFSQCKLILSWDLVPWESHVLDYGSIPKGSFVCSSAGTLQV